LLASRDYNRSREKDKKVGAWAGMSGHITPLDTASIANSFRWNIIAVTHLDGIFCENRGGYPPLMGIRQ
jgi:hypothetical protein